MQDGRLQESSRVAGNNGACCRSRICTHGQRIRPPPFRTVLIRSTVLSKLAYDSQ